MDAATKTTHTPGPWAVDPTGDIGWFQIGDAAATRPVCNIEPWDDEEGGSPEEQANAALIAAAPDMLAALKDLISMELSVCQFTDRAKAAIAKAEAVSQ